MDQLPAGPESGPTLLEAVQELGMKAFDPQADFSSRSKYQHDFDSLLER